MMRGTINGVTTFYPGRHYNKEVGTSATKIQKFYFAGTVTIAVRTLTDSADKLTWVLGDHLGSASTTANADGSLNSVIQYTAFGEIRLTQGITPTKYRYTGQLAQAELGLDYYVARWYDPVLGHFAQADTIIPEPGKSQSFDRYSYVRNNPIKLNDPSGHKDPGECEGDWDCKPTPIVPPECKPGQICKTPKNPENPIDLNREIDLGIYKITYYPYALESDPQFPANDKVPVSGLDPKKTYRRQFIYSKAGIYMQGTGKSEGGDYITIDHYRNQIEYGDDWINKTNPAWWYFKYGKGGTFSEGIPWKSVAIPFGEKDLKPGDKVRIEGYTNIFVVTDTGSFRDPKHLDIFIGEETYENANKLGAKYLSVWLVPGD